jgi:hypothetical protein
MRQSPLCGCCQPLACGSVMDGPLDRARLPQTVSVCGDADISGATVWASEGDLMTSSDGRVLSRLLTEAMPGQRRAGSDTALARTYTSHARAASERLLRRLALGGPDQRRSLVGDANAQVERALVEVTAPPFCDDAVRRGRGATPERGDQQRADAEMDASYVGATAMVGGVLKYWSWSGAGPKGLYLNSHTAPPRRSRRAMRVHTGARWPSPCGGPLTDSPGRRRPISSCAETWSILP